MKYEYNRAADPKMTIRTQWLDERAYAISVTMKNRLTLAVEQATREGKRHLVVFKKVYLSARHHANTIIGKRYRYAVVAELHVPLNAKMRQPNNNKCRASSAKVVAFHLQRDANRQWSRRTSGKIVCSSHYATEFKYRLGRTVRPVGGFDLDNVECAPGIHFFLTFGKARAYL